MYRSPALSAFHKVTEEPPCEPCEPNEQLSEDNLVNDNDSQLSWIVAKGAV